MFEEELARVPKNPPRGEPLPGMRISAALPKSTLIMLLAFAVFFGAMPVSFIFMDPNARLSFGPSSDIQGQIVSIGADTRCRDSKGRRVTYSFDAPGHREYRGTRVICDGSPYFTANAGEPIPIRYLTRDPAVNDIAGDSQGNEPPFFLILIFPFFFLIFLSPMFFPQVREVFRARRLYKHGRLVEGRVVYVKRRAGGTWPGWPGSNSVDLYISHTAPDGRQTESVVWCSNDWLTHQLQPGATVHILLPENKSARAVLLEAFIR